MNTSILLTTLLASSLLISCASTPTTSSAKTMGEINGERGQKTYQVSKSQRTQNSKQRQEESDEIDLQIKKDNYNQGKTDQGINTLKKLEQLGKSFGF